ncbi:hypothetical protein B0H19DRAFT_1237428 [Mycena capillaripes]|nr:hypothetical protein B0H19DRAFT_1237428 [Mycena capillaripes]
MRQQSPLFLCAPKNCVPFSEGCAEILDLRGCSILLTLSSISQRNEEHRRIRRNSSTASSRQFFLRRRSQVPRLSSLLSWLSFPTKKERNSAYGRTRDSFSVHRCVLCIASRRRLDHATRRRIISRRPRGYPPPTRLGRHRPPHIISSRVAPYSSCRRNEVVGLTPGERCAPPLSIASPAKQQDIRRPIASQHAPAATSDCARSASLASGSPPICRLRSAHDFERALTRGVRTQNNSDLPTSQGTWTRRASRGHVAGEYAPPCRSPSSDDWLALVLGLAGEVRRHGYVSYNSDPAHAVHGGGREACVPGCGQEGARRVRDRCDAYIIAEKRSLARGADNLYHRSASGTVASGSRCQDFSVLVPPTTLSTNSVSIDLVHFCSSVQLIDSLELEAQVAERLADRCSMSSASSSSKISSPSPPDEFGTGRAGAAPVALDPTGPQCTRALQVSGRGSSVIRGASSIEDLPTWRSLITFGREAFTRALESLFDAADADLLFCVQRSQLWRSPHPVQG